MSTPVYTSLHVCRHLVWQIGKEVLQTRDKCFLVKSVYLLLSPTSVAIDNRYEQF